MEKEKIDTFQIFGTDLHGLLGVEIFIYNENNKRQWTGYERMYGRQYSWNSQIRLNIVIQIKWLYYYYYYWVVLYVAIKQGQNCLVQII